METDIVNDDFVHDSNYKRIYIKQNIMITKELSIKQKAQRYDEILAKAKAEYAKFEGMLPGDVLEDIFPELKKSEDEKIKKEIINYFRCQSRDEPSRKDIHNKWIAWLEKQGEQKSAEWSEEDEEMWLDAIKYLELFDAQGIHRNKAVPCINWLKSIQDRVQLQTPYKPTEAQLVSLEIACDRNDRIGFDLTQLLKDLKKLIKQ